MFNKLYRSRANLSLIVQHVVGICIHDKEIKHKSGGGRVEQRVPSFPIHKTRCVGYSYKDCACTRQGKKST